VVLLLLFPVPRIRFFFGASASPQANIKRKSGKLLAGKQKREREWGKKSIIEKFCLFYVFIMRSVCQIMIMARNISFIELSPGARKFLAPIRRPPTTNLHYCQRRKQAK